MKKALKYLGIVFLCWFIFKMCSGSRSTTTQKSNEEYQPKNESPILENESEPLKESRNFKPAKQISYLEIESREMSQGGINLYIIISDSLCKSDVGKLLKDLQTQIKSNDSREYEDKDLEPYEVYAFYDVEHYNDRACSGCENRAVAVIKARMKRYKINGYDIIFNNKIYPNRQEITINWCE